MRHVLLALVLSAGVATAALPSAHAASGDRPYYKLNYAKYDYTYAWEVEQARHYASFYWDGKAYCRYPTGWNGPGAYETGTRAKRGHGWAGGYPWQGPGTVADHDDEQSFEEAKALYAKDFSRGPFCGPAHRHHRHRIVLRRKD